MLKWHFPPTGGGVAYGFNDSGQEHFRSNPWEQAIRELIQNSLDAHDKKSGGPVSVRITEMEIPASEIGARDLAGHMEMALVIAKKEKNAEATKFYRRALNVLDEDRINVLAITDTNTTGLVDEKWDTLIYDEGTSEKTGVGAAGGSFGIGKNAPYGVSALRTVCYSTRYDGGKQEKFIARCRISAHQNPDGPSDELLQHVGFGTKAERKRNARAPPTSGTDIHKKFRLGAQGSGIFIIGFDPMTRDWVKDAKESIARNFFVAIHTGRLDIRIADYRINRDSLDEIFKGCGRAEHSRHYYRVIRDDVERIPVVGRMGKFTLQVQAGEEDMPSRIAYVNRRGMLIADQRVMKNNPFYSNVGGGWINYTAVVMAGNDETDEKIRRMEPPNHKSIEFDRILDPKERKATKKQLQEIREEIAEAIRGIISQSSEEHDIHLNELAGVLPMAGSFKGGYGGKKDAAKDALEHRTEEDTQKETESGSDDSGDARNTTQRKESVRKEGDSADGSNTIKEDGGDGAPDTTGDQTVRVDAASALERLRIVRNEEKLFVAFTPRLNNGNPICLAIRTAGEEAERQDAISISYAKAIQPSDVQVSRRDKEICIASHGGGRVLLELGIPPASLYTGYNVELVSNDKPESDT